MVLGWLLAPDWWPAVPCQCQLRPAHCVPAADNNRTIVHCSPYQDNPPGHAPAPLLATHRQVLMLVLRHTFTLSEGCTRSIYLPTYYKNLSFYFYVWHIPITYTTHVQSFRCVYRAELLKFMIIETSSQFSCLMSFHRTTKLISVRKWWNNIQDTELELQTWHHPNDVPCCYYFWSYHIRWRWLLLFNFIWLLHYPYFLQSSLLSYLFTYTSCTFFPYIYQIKSVKQYEPSRSSRRKRFRGCRQFESENTGISNAMFPWFQHRAWLWVGSNSNNRPSTTQHWSRCWHCDKGPATWLWRGWTLGPANIFNIGTGK